MTEPNPSTVTQDVVNKLTAAAEALAEKTGEVAPYAWEVAVRRQVTEAATGLALCALWAVVLTTTFWLSVHWIRKGLAAGPGSDVDWFRPLFTIMLVLTAICLTIDASVASRRVDRLLNPEYYAAVELLGVVK